MPNFQTTRTLKKLNQTFSENILLNKKDAENKIMFQNWNLDFLQFFTLAFFLPIKSKAQLFLENVKKLYVQQNPKIEEKNIYIYKKMQSH